VSSDISLVVNGERAKVLTYLFLADGTRTPTRFEARNESILTYSTSERRVDFNFCSTPAISLAKVLEG
jgi:hypothetical protein